MYTLIGPLPSYFKRRGRTISLPSHYTRNRPSRHFGSADDISAKSRANTQTDKEIADLGNIYRALPKFR